MLRRVTDRHTDRPNYRTLAAHAHRGQKDKQLHMDEGCHPAHSGVAELASNIYWILACMHWVNAVKLCLPEYNRFGNKKKNTLFNAYKPQPFTAVTLKRKEAKRLKL